MIKLKELILAHSQYISCSRRVRTSVTTVTITKLISKINKICKRNMSNEAKSSWRFKSPWTGSNLRNIIKTECSVCKCEIFKARGVLGPVQAVQPNWTPKNHWPQDLLSILSIYNNFRLCSNYKMAQKHGLPEVEHKSRSWLPSKDRATAAIPIFQVTLPPSSPVQTFNSSALPSSLFVVRRNPDQIGDANHRVNSMPSPYFTFLFS
jgi:hypothetical protein